MKRMKKMYSITGLTDAIIKKLAEEINMPESYALDNMALNYWRMTHKGKYMPIPTEVKEKNIEIKMTKEEEQEYKKQIDQGIVDEKTNLKKWLKNYREK